MPGVLVEIGFITNVEEEAYLNSERGQQEVAMAIYRGIKAYKADVEKLQ
jgi:N-acetylmuramoyl-L-alanine amidase